MDKLFTFSARELLDLDDDKHFDGEPVNVEGYKAIAAMRLDDLQRLRTSIRALIDRWRREADDLEERAVRHYDVACLSDGDRCTEKAKELRCRAAEVERAIGGGHANFESGGGK